MGLFNDLRQGVRDLGNDIAPGSGDDIANVATAVAIYYTAGAVGAYVGASAASGLSVALAETAISGATIIEAGYLIGSGAALLTAAALSGSIDRPSPAVGPSLAQGMLVNTSNNVSAIPVIYGTRRVGGPRALVQVSGGTNEFLHLVVVFSEGEIGSIDNLYIGDILTTDAKFSGLVTVEKYVGTDAQAASTALAADIPTVWTVNHKGSGIAYAYLKLKFSVGTYSGFPVITADVKGKKVYDPRTGLTAWSDNPALCIRDYLTSVRYGCGIAAAGIDDASFISAANYCDELVSTPAGNAKRFTCNGVVSVDSPILDNLRQLLTSCRASLIFSAGKYKIVQDRPATAGFAFTEDNITGQWSVTTSGRRKRFNRVTASYFNPANNWQPDFAISESTAYRSTIDNGLVLEGTLDLQFTSDTYMAQRIAGQHLKQSRFGVVAAFTAFQSALRCEVGDVVTITHTTPGWVGKLFRVNSITLKDDEEVEVVCTEYDATVYNLDTLTAVTAAPTLSLPSPFDVTLPAGVALTSGTAELITAGDGTIISRIKCVWTPPANAMTTVAEIQFKVTSDSAWQSLAPTDASQGLAYVTPVKEGLTYNLRIRFVNTLGTSSAWVIATNHTVVGKTAPPSDVANLAYVGNEAGVQLSWTTPSDKDYQDTIIKVGASWATATVIYTGSANTFLWTRPTGTNFTILAKHRDTTGNESLNVATLPVAYVAVAIDNTLVTVGGRNILTKAQILLGGATAATDYYGKTDAFSVVMPAATNYRIQNWSMHDVGAYSISFWIKTSVATTVAFDLCDQALQSISATTAWQFVKVENMAINSSWLNTTYFGFLDFNPTAACTLTVSNLMLEFSTKCSSWSPAPEDMLNSNITLGSIQGTLTGSQVAAGIISANAFVSGIEPVTVVASVPGVKSTTTIVNTTDGKLYRWNGTAYVATVPTTDLSGTVANTQIAAGSITTNRLMVAPTTGNNLWVDPGFSDTTAWLQCNWGTFPVQGSVTDGVSGTTTLRGGIGGSSAYGSSRVPVTVGKTYKVSMKARSVGGNGTIYIRIDGSNVNSGNGYQQIAGTVEGVIPTASWVEYSWRWVATTAWASPMVLLNYVATAGYQEAQDIRIEELNTGDLIVDGAITATQIAANTITAGKIAAGAITATQLAAATITGDRIAANTVAAANIDSRGLSIKDALGNVIFAAGTPLAASNITPASNWINVKTNFVDTAWWSNGATVPWGSMGSSNTMGTVPLGPKGVPDIVMQCSDGGTPVDCGFFNVAIGPVVTSKCYRVVVPINIFTGNPPSCPANLTIGGVANLNTTVAATASAVSGYSTGGTSKWVLMVTYLFPAGSTGNTSTGAGMIDCTTGGFIAPGLSFTMLAATTSLTLKAYIQSDGFFSNLVYIGRPVVEEVNGEETPLREYLASTAVLNSSLTPSIAAAATTATYAGLTGTPGAAIANNSITSGVLHIMRPAGAAASSNVPSQAGTLKIRLPQSWTNTMLRFTLDIYEYGVSGVCSYEIGGYNYIPPTGTWANNPFARYYGPPSAVRPIFFGHDGTYCCIYLGVPAGTWAYPQVQLRDFIAGYSNATEALWATGWQITWEAGGAMNTTAIINNPVSGGLLSGVDQIDSGNASTFIANAAIGAAQIGSLNAAVINAGFINAARIQVGTATVAAGAGRSYASVYPPVNDFGGTATTGTISLTSTGSPVTVIATVGLYCQTPNMTCDYFYLDLMLEMDATTAKWPDNTGATLSLAVKAVSNSTISKAMMITVPMELRHTPAAGTHQYRVAVTGYSMGSTGSYVTMNNGASLGFISHYTSIIATENKI